MKMFTKLMAVGALAGAVVLVRRAMQQGALNGTTGWRSFEDLPRERDEDLASASFGVEDAVLVAASSGLSEVDPVGLTQMGEAVDPEAAEQAHSEVRDQRERLPGNG